MWLLKKGIGWMGEWSPWPPLWFLICKAWLEKCCGGYVLIAYKTKPALRLSTLPIIHLWLPFSLLPRIGRAYQVQWRKKSKTAAFMLFHSRTLNYIILESMHRYRSSEIFPKSTLLFPYISNHYHQMYILSYILEMYLWFTLVLWKSGW